MKGQDVFFVYTRFLGNFYEQLVDTNSLYNVCQFHYNCFGAADEDIPGLKGLNKTDTLLGCCSGKLVETRCLSHATNHTVNTAGHHCRRQQPKS